MKSPVFLREIDINLVKADFNDPVVKDMNKVVMDVTGWDISESQRGSYEIDIPTLDPSAKYSIYLSHITNPKIVYDGWISADTLDQQVSEHTISGSAGQYLQSIGLAADPWLTELPNGYAGTQAGFVLVQLQSIFESFSKTLSQLLTQTYNAGQVASPYAPIPGPNIPIFVKTNYLGISTVGSAWATLLNTAGSKVFFTLRPANTPPNQTPVTLSVECSVTDSTGGVIEISLNKSQTNIKLGDYFWQLEVRTYNGDIAEEVWVMQEGKLYAKPSFKL
jgi:hypothetical protein